MGRWWFSKIALEGEGQGRTQDRLVGSGSKEDPCCLSLVDLLLGGKAHPEERRACGESKKKVLYGIQDFQGTRRD